MPETPKVPNANDVANKWANRVSQSTGDFQAGVQKTSDWQQKTAAAKESYNAGVSRAVANDSFSKGVAATPNSEWQLATAGAASRWSQGAGAAKNDMAAASAKVLGVIGSVQMDDRGPKGTNYNRVQQVGEALRKAKEAGQLR